MPVKDSAHLTQFNKVSQKYQDLQAPSAAACSKQASRFFPHIQTYNPLHQLLNFKVSKFDLEIFNAKSKLYKPSVKINT